MDRRGRTQESRSERTAEGHVRVLDNAARPSHAEHHAGRNVALPAGLAAMVVLALWAISGGGSPVTQSPEVEPAALAGPAVSQDLHAMPELSGLTLTEAQASLDEVGLSGIEVELEALWQASYRRPPGEILGQVPPAGQAIVAPLRVTVVVSEGGPVASFSDLPPDVREFAAGLPGFDIGAPLLELTTASGVAFKNDDWLFGECAAVALAYRGLADTSYLDRCFERRTVSVTGVLIDGTRYSVAGLPTGQYAAPFPSGVIVIAAAAESRALGITTYAPREPTSVGITRVVEGTLTIAAGSWRSDVADYGDIAADLGPDWEAALPRLIRPRVEGSHLVVGLDSPLRWQRPGELPSRIAADYGPFRVVAGCVPNVSNVVCDASGAISVERVASQFDLTGVSVRIEADDVPAG